MKVKEMNVLNKKAFGTTRERRLQQQSYKTFILKKLRDQGRQVVIVLLQSLCNLSITWMMEHIRFWLGILWQLMNKWNLVYLGYKVF